MGVFGIGDSTHQQKLKSEELRSKSLVHRKVRVRYGKLF
jgi:hypothetical protein